MRRTSNDQHGFNRYPGNDNDAPLRPGKNMFFAFLGCVAVNLAILATATSAKPQGQDFTSAARDQTILFVPFHLQGFYVSSSHNLDGAMRNTGRFRAAFPGELGDAETIAYLALPNLAETRSGTVGYMLCNTS